MASASLVGREDLVHHYDSGVLELYPYVQSAFEL